MNHNSPKITVYITNFNYADYIDKAIQSVLEQSFKDFELIIIDDGSTDGSREIINSYEKTKNVFLVFQKNKGLNKTNNTAIKLSRGKYIMRLDADDYLDPRAFEIMVSELESRPEVALVFPDYYLIDEQGNILKQIRRHDFTKEVTLLDQPAHGACTLIRKEFLLQIGGYNESFDRQDGYDLWLSITKKYPIRNINLPLFYYRQHTSNLTKNEEQLLKVRSQIMANHVKKREIKKATTIAVIPVRGRELDPRSLPLVQLGRKKLIDWTIDAALESTVIDDVVISTPNETVQNHVTKKYGSKVHIFERSINQARINEPLEPVLLEVSQSYSKNVSTPDILAVLFIEAPFRSPFYIDKAVHTKQLYEVDVVDGIREEDDIFYYHNGDGLQPWNLSSNLRLERDILYRRVGGIHVIDRKHLESQQNLLSGKIGHIAIDQRAAFTIRSEFDWKIAQQIAAMEN